MNYIWLLLLLGNRGYGNQCSNQCSNQCNHSMHHHSHHTCHHHHDTCDNSLIQPRQQIYDEHNHCHKDMDDCKLTPPAWQEFSSNCNCD